MRPTSSAQAPHPPGGSIVIGGDLTVARMGYGAMRLCGPRVWSEPDDRDGARRVLTRAVDLGITLIDTADAYGPYVNETLIADVLHPYPEGLLIATKGGLVRPPRKTWDRDGRPEHLRAACEGSLARLRLECIDLYQLHAPDPHVPFADSVGALAQLRSEGKIRHVGLSNVSAAQVRQAQRLVPIASVQNRYNHSDRSSAEVLALCEQMGIAFLPWYPLAAGSHASDTGALARVARRHGVSPARLSLAWLLAHSPVTVPIPGTSSIEHLEDNVAAAALELSAADLADLA